MATSRYFAGGSDRGGILNFKVDSRGFRIPKGQPGAGAFTSAQAEFAERNRQLARQIQADVANNILARRVQTRSGVSTGRLLKATASPKNFRADQFGLHVGIEKHLNASSAKYWRTIEEGSAKTWADTPGGRPSMIGMELHGFFGTSIIGMTNTEYGSRALAGPSFSKPYRGGRDGKYMPSPNKGGKGVVRRNIEPTYAYRDAFKDGDVAGRAFANVERFLFKLASDEGFPIIARGSSKYFRADGEYYG